MATLDGSLGRAYLLADFDLSERKGFPARGHPEEMVDELPATPYLPRIGWAREDFQPPLDLGGRTHQEEELDAMTGRE